MINVRDWLTTFIYGLVPIIGLAGLLALYIWYPTWFLGVSALIVTYGLGRLIRSYD